MARELLEASHTKGKGCVPVNLIFGSRFACSGGVLGLHDASTKTSGERALFDWQNTTPSGAAQRPTTREGKTNAPKCTHSTQDLQLQPQSVAQCRAQPTPSTGRTAGAPSMALTRECPLWALAGTQTEHRAQLHCRMSGTHTCQDGIGETALARGNRREHFTSPFNA